MLPWKAQCDSIPLPQINSARFRYDLWEGQGLFYFAEGDYNSSLDTQQERAKAKAIGWCLEIT